MKIRIEGDTATPSGTRVWVDDEELKLVRSVEFVHEAGRFARVIIKRFKPDANGQPYYDHEKNVVPMIVFSFPA